VATSAILTGIEDPIQNTVLYSFEANPKNSRIDQTIKRRSGSYTVLGVDYGVNPFGNYAAPIDIRTFVWGFRVVVPQQGDLDLAGDLFRRAIMGHDRMLRLVQKVSGRWERVAIVQCLECQDVIAQPDNWRHRDFVTTWEMLTPWTDRISRGPHTVGDLTGGAPVMGATALVLGAGTVALTSASVSFSIVTDGSDGLGIPTVDDNSPVITIVGPFGSANGFNLTNVTSIIRGLSGGVQATSLHYTQPIPAGKVLKIDCGANAITLDGVDVWDNLSWDDAQPWWFQIVGGTINVIQIAAYDAVGGTFDASQSRISVAWHGLY
jgi:hypothetical protein